MKGAALCHLHKIGVPAGTPPFYVEGCPRCELKLATGLVPVGTPPPAADRYRRNGRRGKATPPQQMDIVPNTGINGAD